jgi:hypothetical protein
MKATDTPFGRMIISEDVPKGTILLVPPVTLNHYFNATTGEVKEYFKFDPKVTGIITGIGEL